MVRETTRGMRGADVNEGVEVEEEEEADEDDKSDEDEMADEDDEEDEEEDDDEEDEEDEEADVDVEEDDEDEEEDADEDEDDEDEDEEEDEPPLTACALNISPPSSRTLSAFSRSRIAGRRRKLRMACLSFTASRASTYSSLSALVLAVVLAVVVEAETEDEDEAEEARSREGDGELIMVVGRGVAPSNVTHAQHNKPRKRDEKTHKTVTEINKSRVACVRTRTTGT